MVSMVALGSGVAIAPDAVLYNSRVRTVQLDYQFEPFKLGICMQSKRLHEPLMRAFWQVAAEKK